MTKKQMPLQGKRALVLGLGVSGQAAARLLLKRGARVVIRDDASDALTKERAAALWTMGAQVELNGAPPLDESFDFAVLSPGISLQTPLARRVLAKGTEIISELELGWRFCRCPVIGITGTNGKTTTTELVTAVLKAAGKRAVAAGNIGVAFCEVAEMSDQLDAVVLEVSSFQLETIEKFRPQVSVLLNITPDHFDRYASMRDYTFAKARIFHNQKAADFAVLNAATASQLESLGIQIKARRATFAPVGSGLRADLWLQDGVIHGRRGYLRGKVLAMNETQLRGPHNAENIMAALAVGNLLAVPRDTMLTAIKMYQPQPHRMEVVAEFNGVTFINDSKATNTDALEKALLTFASRVVLIAGGKDKRLDYAALKPLVAEKARCVVLLGEAAPKIAAAWGDTVRCVTANDLKQAVALAFAAAQRGDAVLLSPACSSFDMFRNYAERGDEFRRLAREISISSETRATPPSRPRESDAVLQVSGEKEENAPLPIGAKH
jgi:UDP-N-acetylmuramoylalanine--D-glutamate ligase